jgi:uncharacterized protein YqjF (DUF2071 family)
MKKFLGAEWQNLAMANYEIDPKLLSKHIPRGTELDIWNGCCYVSLVAFMFVNTKVLGFSIPFHKNFEEVNLRFYVRYKHENEWRRGVVFVKEIVPKPMISFVANTVYGEHYHTLPMKHNISSGLDKLEVEYFWKFRNEWNHFKVIANPEEKPILHGSEAEFITEHYWGYTRINDSKTSQYEVEHPRWNQYNLVSYDIQCNAVHLYGEPFGECLSQKPVSVILAKGSEVSVRRAGKI